ncbi:hypothetical protein, partial [Pseudomonas amygdali]
DQLTTTMGIVTRKDFSQLKGQKIFLTCEKTSPILKSADDFRWQKRQGMTILLELSLDSAMINHHSLDARQMKIYVVALFRATAHAVRAELNIYRQQHPWLPCR